MKPRRALSHALSCWAALLVGVNCAPGAHVGSLDGDGGVKAAGDGGPVITLTAEQANDAVVTTDHVDLMLPTVEALHLKSGDVVVSPPGSPEANPDGFLRRVASIEVVGGHAIIRTQPAGLLDIMPDGATFSFSNPPTHGRALSTYEWSSGFALKDRFIPIKLTIPVGAGAVEGVISGKIGLKELSGSLSLDASGIVGPRQGLDLPFVVSLNGYYDATVIGLAGLSIGISGTPSKDDAALLPRKLADAIKLAIVSNPGAYSFTAPVIDGRARLPPIPVPFLPFAIPCSIDIKVDVGCSVGFTGGASFSRGFQSSGSFAISMDHAVGGSVETSFTKTGFDLNPIASVGTTFQGGIKIECKVTPSFTVMLFDIGGPRFGIGPAYYVAADYSERCLSPPASTTPDAFVTTSWGPKILIRADLAADVLFGEITVPLIERDILQYPPETSTTPLGPSQIPYSQCVPCGGRSELCCRNPPVCDDLQACGVTNHCPACAQKLDPCGAGNCCAAADCVSGQCKPPCDATTARCADGNCCAAADCVSGQCKPACDATTARCADGNCCAAADCVSGQCKPACDATTARCADGNCCAAADCVSGQCKPACDATTARCADGNCCAAADCVSGQCKPACGAPPPIPDGSFCCGNDRCGPARACAKCLKEVVATPQSAIIVVGQTQRVALTLRDSDGQPTDLSGRGFQWTSDPTGIISIADFDGSGAVLLRAEAVGSTKVRFTSEGVAATINIAVCSERNAGGGPWTGYWQTDQRTEYVILHLVQSGSTVRGNFLNAPHYWFESISGTVLDDGVLELKWSVPAYDCADGSTSGFASVTLQSCASFSGPLRLCQPAGEWRANFINDGQTDFDSLAPASQDVPSDMCSPSTGCGWTCLRGPRAGKIVPEGGFCNGPRCCFWLDKTNAASFDLQRWVNWGCPETNPLVPGTPPTFVGCGTPGAGLTGDLCIYSDGTANSGLGYYPQLAHWELSSLCPQH